MIKLIQILIFSSFFLFKPLHSELFNSFVKLEEPIDISEITFYHKNKKIRIINIQKDIIILNLWATWCQPCLKEMPSLDKLAVKLNKNIFYILPLSQDNGGVAVIKKYYEKLNIKNLDIFNDADKTFSNSIFLRGIPSTFIIKNNKIIAKLEGEINWENKNIIKELESFQ